MLVIPTRGRALITTGENDIKERLSIGVATLVAARAGCELSEIKVDRSSVDVTIRPVRGEPVCIDAQLKSSSSLTRDDEHLVIDIPVNNYNALRAEIVGNARILVVLELDPDDSLWLSIDHERLIARRSAYWMDLYGAEATTNTTWKRVRIPLTQTFTPESLQQMMHRRYDNLLSQAGGVS